MIKTNIIKAPIRNYIALLIALFVIVPLIKLSMIGIGLPVYSEGTAESYLQNFSVIYLFSIVNMGCFIAGIVIFDRKATQILLSFNSKYISNGLYLLFTVAALYFIIDMIRAMPFFVQHFRSNAFVGHFYTLAFQIFAISNILRFGNNRFLLVLTMVIQFLLPIRKWTFLVVISAVMSKFSKYPSLFRKIAFIASAPILIVILELYKYARRYFIYGGFGENQNSIIYGFIADVSYFDYATLIWSEMSHLPQLSQFKYLIYSFVPRSIGGEANNPDAIIGQYMPSINSSSPSFGIISESILYYGNLFILPSIFSGFIVRHIANIGVIYQNRIVIMATYLLIFIIIKSSFLFAFYSFLIFTAAAYASLPQKK